PEKYYKVLHLPDGGDGRYRKKSLRPRSSDASSHRGAELEVKLRLFQSTGRHYKPLPEEGQFSWVCTGKGKRREMEDRGRANLDMFFVVSDPSSIFSAEAIWVPPICMDQPAGVSVPSSQPAS
ncbi:hypothetical protein JOQ06_016906, partial [Pogonophryne albipinna]